MGLKNEYQVKLRCATCGSEDKFEFNDDKSYVKCTFCNREYFGGIEELKEFNEEAFEETKKEIEQDVAMQIQNEFKKAFKGNKFIKFK
jgi:phage/plasmid primase-like uncharacterized protein